MNPAIQACALSVMLSPSCQVPVFAAASRPFLRGPAPAWMSFMTLVMSSTTSERITCFGVIFSPYTWVPSLLVTFVTKCARADTPVGLPRSLSAAIRPGASAGGFEEPAGLGIG